MLETEAGGMVALELWTLAKASGRTPWEAVHDPHLAYNLTVMRAAVEVKRYTLDRAEQHQGVMAQRILALE
jgi:hypothetical protein